MTPSVSGCSSPMLLLLLVAGVLLLQMPSVAVASLEPETCFSRQHRSVIVNVRQALNRPTTVMDARVVRSERDCVLACCSEEVKPGAKCNMAVFNANKHGGDDNCFLFHCQTEQDCPLMKAQEGINTHDIYKGLNHPTTGRPTTTTTTSTTTTTTTQPTTTQAPPTTTQAPSTTTQAPPTTTQPLPPTTTTQAPPTTTQAPPTTTQAPPIIIIATMPPITASPTTPNPTRTTPAPAAVTTNRKPNKTNKKQNKNTKKGKAHQPTSTTSTTTTTSTTPTTTTTTTSTTSIPTSHSPTTSTLQRADLKTTDGPQPIPEGTIAATTTTSPAPNPITNPPTTTTPPSTTTKTTPTPTTTTAPPPPMTTTALPSPPTTTSTASASLVIVPKDSAQPDHALQNTSATQGRAVAATGAIKSGMVAFMVLGLAMLTLALAVGGRKAMESFDRRHYTRLELNDLHYEV